MKQAIVSGFLVVTAAVALLWFVPNSRSEKGALNEGARPLEKKPALQAEIVKRLYNPIQQDEFSGPLKEILSYLADYPTLHPENGLCPIIINGEAFKQDLIIQEVENQVVKFPKLAHVNYDTLLRALLDQVRGTYILRPDHVEVTTCDRLLDEINAEKPVHDNCDADQGAAASRAVRKLRPVHIHCESKPFEEALKQVQDSTGLNLLLDPRAKEQAKTPVTVKLANVPVQTAVRVIADMAGLKLAVLDNVYYVTTPENADKIEKAQERSNLKRTRMEPATP